MGKRFEVGCPLVHVCVCEGGEVGWYFLGEETSPAVIYTTLWQLK